MVLLDQAFARVGRNQDIFRKVSATTKRDKRRSWAGQRTLYLPWAPAKVANTRSSEDFIMVIGTLGWRVRGRATSDQMKWSWTSLNFGFLW